MSRRRECLEKVRPFNDSMLYRVHTSKELLNHWLGITTYDGCIAKLNSSSIGKHKGHSNQTKQLENHGCRRVYVNESDQNYSPNLSHAHDTNSESVPKSELVG